MEELEQIRTIRVKKINPFLLSNGIVLKGSFIIFFILTFQLILTIVLFLEYKLFTYPQKDFFELLNQIGGDIFIIQRFLILHYIDNLFIGTLNSWVSDLTFIKIQIPYLYDFINYKNFEISFEGYIELFISFFITLFLFSLTILQIRDQQKFSSIGLHSIYSPLVLIVLSHYYKDYIYFKRVVGIKSDNIDIQKKNSLIELFFNKSDLFLNYKLDELDLKIETKQTLLGFYNYYKVSIYKKETKKK